MSAFTPGIHLPLFSKALKDCLSAEWCLFIILNGGLEHVLPKTVQLIIATSSRRYPSSFTLFFFFCLRRNEFYSKKRGEIGKKTKKYFYIIYKNFFATPARIATPASNVSRS